MICGGNYLRPNKKVFVYCNSTDPGKWLDKLDGIKTDPRPFFLHLNNKKAGKMQTGFFPPNLSRKTLKL